LLSKYLDAVSNIREAHDDTEAQTHPTTVGEYTRNHPIWEAIEEGHTDVVFQLLDSRNLDLIMIDSHLISLLHCVIETGNYILVEPLIARGANPNTRDLYG
jgi:ankyrin repeat protein